jgi:hypothetical protein
MLPLICVLATFVQCGGHVYGARHFTSMRYTERLMTREHKQEFVPRAFVVVDEVKAAHLLEKTNKIF